MVSQAERKGRTVRKVIKHIKRVGSGKAEDHAGKVGVGMSANTAREEPEIPPSMPTLPNPRSRTRRGHVPEIAEQFSGRLP